MSDAVSNITFELKETAKTDPELLALIVGDRHLTYLELDALVWGAARFITDKGLCKGDTAALIFSDQLHLAITILGTMRVGAVPLVLSPTHPIVQREELIAVSNASLLFTDRDDFKSAVITSVYFDEACAADMRDFRDLFCAFPAAFAQIIVGSGSTGIPRLIPVSHQVLRGRIEIFRRTFDLKPGRRIFFATPLYFPTPVTRLLASLCAGATGVLWDQRNSITDAIEKAQPYCMALSVYHAEYILQEASKKDGFDLSSLKIVSVGSSTISEDLRRRLKQDLKTNLHIEYGTNEITPLTFAYPTDLNSAKGGVGHPLPGVQLEIVDGSDRQLEEGEIGYIRARSPGKIDGYLNDSDPDRFRGGWFYPGDLGKWSEDGQLIHCGRADQMMILDGMNIYPAEIERVLGEHSSVEDIAVFPIKHAIHQNIPVAVVSLKPGTRGVEMDLQAYARERLGVRAPRHILMADKLPRNKQGKLIRAELELLMAEFLERKVKAQKAVAVKGTDTFARQRMRRQTLKFVAPENLSLEHLGVWRPYFENETLACATPKVKLSFPHQIEPIASWIEHVLALTRDFLLAVHVPCFERISLLKCTLSSEKDGKTAVYETVIEIPVLENLHPGTLHRAINAAISNIKIMQANPPSEEYRENLFNSVKKEVIWRVSQGMKYGSCTNRVLHAAYRMGLPFNHLGLGVYQLGWGASAILIDRSSSSRDSAMGNKLTMFKQVTAGIIRNAGLPAPEHRLVKNLTAARNAAERIGWPVVIKPADQERGEGVRVDVHPEQLVNAFENALEASKYKEVLVERQAAGVCHRLFVAHDQLLYAVKRLPIGIYGDNVHTVSELVEAECAAQLLKSMWNRSKIQPLDDLGLAAIKSAGLSEKSVPEKGRFVALRRIESTDLGGVDEEVTDTVHPENIRIALVATKLCGLDVAGVDIITEDISKPWWETGAIINEVNFKPLLGSGEISYRHLPEYVRRLTGEQGRIPVEVFVGDERALNAAKAHQKTLTKQGIVAFLTNEIQTLDASGRELPLAVDGLYARVRALVLSGSAEAIAIVVQTDTLLDEGLPLEGVDAVHAIAEPILSKSAVPPSQRRRILMELLASWVWPRKPAQTEVK